MQEQSTEKKIMMLQYFSWLLHCPNYQVSPLRNFEFSMQNKIIFVAFAMEDERYRNHLKAQSLHTRSPFEYIDMSVKKAYASAWKEKVRARIRRSDGVIVLVSRNSLKSSGQDWEIRCAREEGKKILGLRIHKDDSFTLPGIKNALWTWDNVADFIDSL